MTEDVKNYSIARFGRFERVRVEGRRGSAILSPDRTGTVVWCDPPQKATGSWLYCVFIHASSQYLTVLECDLTSTGQFDSAQAYLGVRFEISHDLLPNDEGTFEFVEGTYRLPGKFWEVMVFSKWDLPEFRHRRMTWDSGITGMVFYVPIGERLDRAYVERAMSETFGANHWFEVRGPDSMVLR